MAFGAKIVADSISPAGHRLTTFCITYPRFIHSELMTHRMFSRNAASSRAIPIEQVIGQVMVDPFIPTFNARVKGMGVGDELEGLSQMHAQSVWLRARDESVKAAEELIGVDKSRVNRLLEPYSWMTTLLTGTDFGNFFALRNDENAQPEFRTIASMMQQLYEFHAPSLVINGGRHMPLVDLEEIQNDSEINWFAVSVGRCARVSYLTHEGKRDPQVDIALYDKLLENRHLSPLEHVATPFTAEEWEFVSDLQLEIGNFDIPFDRYLRRQSEYHGNLHGWHSLRTTIPNEHDYSLVKHAISNSN